MGIKNSKTWKPQSFNLTLSSLMEYAYNKEQ